MVPRALSTRGARGQLVLASASPRRRDLLTLLGVEFTAIATGVEELSEGVPDEVVVENALRKARAGAAMSTPGSAILGVDTDVALDGALLGKATEPDAARRRLRALSGRTHEVLSGIALVADGVERSDMVRTRVELRPLSDQEIDIYIASGEWHDRAGAYAVQGLGSALVDRIEGDLSNVIGLPIPATCRMIAGLQDD